MFWKRFLEDVGFAGAITAVVAVIVYLPPATQTAHAVMMVEPGDPMENFMLDSLIETHEALFGPADPEEHWGFYPLGTPVTGTGLYHGTGPDDEPFTLEVISYWSHDIDDYDDLSPDEWLAVISSNLQTGMFWGTMETASGSMNLMGAAMEWDQVVYPESGPGGMGFTVVITFERFLSDFAANVAPSKFVLSPSPGTPYPPDPVLISLDPTATSPENAVVEVVEDSYVVLAESVFSLLEFSDFADLGGPVSDSGPPTGESGTTDPDCGPDNLCLCMLCSNGTLWCAGSDPWVMEAYSQYKLCLQLATALLAAALAIATQLLTLAILHCLNTGGASALCIAVAIMLYLVTVTAELTLYYFAMNACIATYQAWLNLAHSRACNT